MHAEGCNTHAALIFPIAACFQFGNNLGLVAAIEPLFTSVEAAAETKPDADDVAAHEKSESQPQNEPRNVWIPIVVVAAINLLIVSALFGSNLCISRSKS